MMGRLEQLQAEVQQLTGKVEEQTFQINELKKRQNTMYGDFDDRLQSLENKSAEGAASTDAEAAPQASEPAPAPAQATLATAASAPTKPEVSQAAAPVSVTADEKQQYQHAYDALRTGHTSQSIAEFEAFLARNPASGLANNAQYWLGEAHRVNQDAESARKAFSKVVENYPGGAKVPDALLKLGYIELEQNNINKARDYLTRVTQDYPGTAPAHLAAKKLLSIDGGGQ
jgi:tol-pal system protein YbgF